MNIDLSKLKLGYWWENCHGDILEDKSEDPENVIGRRVLSDNELPEDQPLYLKTLHVLEVSEETTEYYYHPEHMHRDSQLWQALIQFRGLYRLAQRYMRFMGKRRTYKSFFVSTTHIGKASEKCILAMANSGDYTLSEAIYVYGNACERCANALFYKYMNGEDGYPEGSEEWHKCNTKCEFCTDEVNHE